MGQVLAAVLAEIKNHGPHDMLTVVRDGPQGTPVIWNCGVSSASGSQPEIRLR